MGEHRDDDHVEHLSFKIETPRRGRPYPFPEDFAEDPLGRGDRNRRMPLTAQFPQAVAHHGIFHADIQAYQSLGLPDLPADLLDTHFQRYGFPECQSVKLGRPRQCFRCICHYGIGL